MTRKIFRSIFLVAIIALFAAFIVIIGVMYNYFSDTQFAQLHSELSLAAHGVEKFGITYLDDLNIDAYRITWISEDGSVLYDSAVDASSMENHSEREEIAEAFIYGTGESRRYSSTLTEITLYFAQKLSDGTVLRLSVKQGTVFSLTLSVLTPFIVVVVVVLLLSAFLANRMSSRIVEPLNEIDLNHPLKNNTYEEIEPLLHRIDRLHGQINDQLAELKQKNDEFTQITENMQEGLVLLSEDLTILSINPAAVKLFGADSSCAGQSFLTVDHSRTMSSAIERAIEEGHSHIKSEHNGQTFQFDINRIESDGKILGIIILSFDYTEHEQSERSRREFTANVSHELKTPLQTIMGSAELIENGIVRHEDMPRFISNIRTEAARLLALIEDIIRLSQLDEGQGFTTEEVDILDIAKETAVSLTEHAKKKNVQLSVTGESAVITGVPRLLSEIVYNLCENAVKYNIDGGSVTVSVTRTDNEAILCVKDTGIGIPPEHHSRIFERFYRVDKSHSKQIGGTGLGLSIVKHAVQFHKGSVDLESSVGQGTTITITFPKQPL